MKLQQVRNVAVIGLMSLVASPVFAAFDVSEVEAAIADGKTAVAAIGIGMLVIAGIAGALKVSRKAT